ncbi:hypothetical protein M6D81_21540 [Paenibacillus sp. J5C_2022]|uniref:hypothetical protein n=1 Tax=Paenibacillus sp. J5C2022 TaxID=2977129 RepID=UPI0021D3E711|nr:hypothetical protein [Paenibacillus sp. J5C2022]MCU6711280.1 hypothetical protein [Paenibacillus sp. J5C2022]
MSMNTHFEKWLWIELIGFDNQLPDYGVEDFLSRVGFHPEGLSILFFTPDFIHAHQGMKREWALPPECCSYAGRPYGRERMRQVWTNFQLHGLVKELQRQRVEVYCSFFNLFEYISEGQILASEWCDDHRYLCELRKNGEYYGSLNPLRRFKDGSYYEDLFIEKLSETLSDYGFDGYHGSDGYTSPRITLADADYSDDMVGQFRETLSPDMANLIAPLCEGHPDQLKQRAEWIWENMREQWIGFYSDRWEQLWRKIVNSMHTEGRKVLFNTAWTRDPFEALYRYGVDYKRIANTGIDGFVVETVISSLSIGAAGVEMEPYYDFMAMLLTIKAYVPEARLICLNSIHDTTERWDALRHAPTVIERDIYSLSNLFVVDERGELARCSSGFVACLSDGIEKHEWQWIDKRWELGFEANPKQWRGACLVWSDRAFERQLNDYIGGRGWTAHKFVHELSSRGVPLYAAVRIEQLHLINGPIVVVNPHLFPEEELAAIMSYDKGARFLLGSEPDAYSNAGEDVTSRDPSSWLDPLPVREISMAYLQSIVDQIIESSDTPAIQSGKGEFKIMAYETDAGCSRVFIYNENMNYASATIDWGRTIRKVIIKNDFPGVPITPEDSGFQVRVPGRGIVILDVYL